MSRCVVDVGYSSTIETKPGIFEDEYREVSHVALVLSSKTAWVRGARAGDDVELNQRLSIIPTPDTYANVGAIKYVTYYGVKWKVISINMQRPRMVLTVGGIFNA